MEQPAPATEAQHAMVQRGSAEAVITACGGGQEGCGSSGVM